MKIAIISSGIESLSLFKFLSKYNHQYLIYWDSLNAPYGEKNFETWLQAIQIGIEWAKNHGAEKIILPPVFELYFLSLSDREYFEKTQIFPLFSNYLLQKVFPNSLVGKLGIFGEYQMLKPAQQFITILAKNYIPTFNQSKIKKFAFPFYFWSKDTTIFSHLLHKLGWKSFLVNTVIKTDLRYFKDAAVDSLIPLNYSYFHAQNTISKFLNFKKIKFHKLEILEEIFVQEVANKKEDDYSIAIHFTDSDHMLRSSKKLIRILQKGKSTTIQNI